MVKIQTEDIYESVLNFCGNWTHLVDIANTKNSLFRNELKKNCTDKHILQNHKVNNVVTVDQTSVCPNYQTVCEITQKTMRLDREKHLVPVSTSTGLSKL